MRLSLPTVCKVASLLKEVHCSRVRDAGFGVVFDLTVKKNVSRILMCYLMGVIDPATMIMDFGNGRVLRINHDAVHHCQCTKRGVLFCTPLLVHRQLEPRLRLRLVGQRKEAKPQDNQSNAKPETRRAEGRGELPRQEPCQGNLPNTS